MRYQFYADDTLLFVLEDAIEYDTATPYRYALSRFVNVAERIRQGQSVTVISRGDSEQTCTLQTVEHLWTWLSKHFAGFERFVP